MNHQLGTFTHPARWPWGTNADSMIIGCPQSIIGPNEHRWHSIEHMLVNRHSSREVDRISSDSIGSSHSRGIAIECVLMANDWQKWFIPYNESVIKKVQANRHSLISWSMKRIDGIGLEKRGAKDIDVRAECRSLSASASLCLPLSPSASPSPPLFQLYDYLISVTFALTESIDTEDRTQHR